MLRSRERLTSSSSPLTTAPFKLVLGSFGLNVESCFTPAFALPGASVKGTIGVSSSLPSNA